MPKKRYPKDPRDYYVQAVPKVSLEQVAKAYKGRSDCTLHTLKNRCVAENWVQLRAELRIHAADRALELATESMAQDVARTWHAHNTECFELAENLKRIGQQLMRQYVKVQRVDGMEVTMPSTR